MTTKPRNRGIKTTKLIVGEGRNEKSFLIHLKSLFLPEDCDFDVKISNGYGGSPKNILEFASKRIENFPPDKAYALLDSDIPLCSETLKIRNQYDIEILLSSPICLEGMILKICGKSLPKNKTAKDCKQKMRSEMAGDPFTDSFLKNNLTSEVLLEAQKDIPDLKRLIDLFSKK